METPRPSSLSSPEPCTDLTQVQGPVIEFGREGGNILPHSVMIFSDGRIVPEGNANVRVDRLSPLTVKALVQLANSQNFWLLPEFTGEEFNLDIPSEFVTIQLSCNSRHVAVRDKAERGCFAELYALLQDLVTA